MRERIDAITERRPRACNWVLDQGPEVDVDRSFQIASCVSSTGRDAEIPCLGFSRDLPKNRHL